MIKIIFQIYVWGIKGVNYIEMISERSVRSWPFREAWEVDFSVCYREN